MRTLASYLWAAIQGVLMMASLAFVFVAFVWGFMIHPAFGLLAAGAAAGIVLRFWTGTGG